MKKLKLYIETSAWNFFFADDAPEKRDSTKEFFATIERGVYELFISNIMLIEIDKAPEEHRKLLMDLIGRCKPSEIQVTNAMQLLAEKYIQRKIVPAKKLEDALHVAIATVAELDAVITWNYRHLANLRKSELFYNVNLEEGYSKKIELITPLEVIDDEV